MRTAIVILVIMAFAFFQPPASAEDYFGDASKKIDEGRIKSASRYLSRGASSGDERCEFVLGLWALAGIDGDGDSAFSGSSSDDPPGDGVQRKNLFRRAELDSAFGHSEDSTTRLVLNEGL